MFFPGQHLFLSSVHEVLLFPLILHGLFIIYTTKHVSFTSTLPFPLTCVQQMANEIKRKQEQCAETEAALLECCRQYEAVSRPAAALYMTLASLTSLSHMYQYSLSWYITLYISIIDNT